MVVTRSNRTVVRAILGAFAPAVDGCGGDIELTVLRNDSPMPEDDFLRPHAGAVLTAFTFDAPTLAPGSEVDIQLTFVGGPRGGRPVVQEIAAAG